MERELRRAELSVTVVSTESEVVVVWRFVWVTAWSWNSTG